MILFAAIKIPPSIAKDFARMQKSVSGAHWHLADKLHITLGYFGDVEPEKAEMLDRELAREPMPSFELVSKGGGHFGHNEPHAIWAGVEHSDELLNLNALCKRAARAVKIPMERRKFKPHVTLAYLRPHASITRIIAWEKAMADFETRPFLVDQFALYSSHPQKYGTNLYRIEATYPLLGRALIDAS